MVDEVVKTEVFDIIKTDTKQDDATDIAWDVKLLATLKDLEITDKCRGFLIDGDMAIKMADYFDGPRNDSRSGT